MSTGAKAAVSRNKMLEEALASAERGKVTTKQHEATQESSSAYTNIKQNAFFIAVFDQSTSDAQKEEALAALLTFNGTAEELRANVEAFDTFKEYLQSIREEMAVDTIKMSDPKNFSVLRDTYESMNGGLIDFENKINPLTELLDALEQLRVDGETMDVFREIKDDETRNAEIKRRSDEISAKFIAVQNDIEKYELSIATANEDKNLFGQVKKSAREEIAKLEVYKTQAIDKLALIATEEQTLRSETAVNSGVQDKHADAKRKLREMLDLDADGHQKRGEELINSAVTFVANSKDKIGTIREHLTKMEGQIINLDNSSNDMTYVFALIDGGTKKAETANKEIREKIASDIPAEESTVQRLSRERRQREVDEHIARLGNSSTDTTATIADLTSQSIRIKDMKDSNQGQIQMAKEMHARGVAGVADRISTVIQAVGQAALSESSNMAASTLDKMRRDTDELAQKHSLQVALSIQDRNVQLEAAIENLAQYGKVHEAATKITRDGLADMQRLVGEMETAAKEVANNVSKSYSLAAEASSGVTEATPTAKETNTGGVRSPFDR